MGLAKAKRPKRPTQLFMGKVHLCGPHPEGINLWANSMLWEEGKQHSMMAKHQDSTQTAEVRRSKRNFSQSLLSCSA